MSLFKNIKEAKFNEGGVYFLPGNYLVKVDKVKIGETRQNIAFFVVETTILESDNSERRPGSSCSWMAMADKDAFLGNVKHFVSVATDTDMAEIDEAGVEMVVSEENPLGGTILRIQATNIKTREKKDFTKVIFKEATVEDFRKYKAA